MGHPTHSDMAAHNGMAIYRLTWDEADESWHSCVQVAGDGLLDAGWVDGIGPDSRFSNTAQDMALLTHDTAHVVLIVADTDNRALRYVDVTVPVEEAQDDEGVVGKALKSVYPLWHTMRTCIRYYNQKMNHGPILQLNQ